jgi:hypothetical protein
VIEGEMTLDDIAPLVACATPTCERMVDPRDPSVLHEMTGWVKRRNRATKMRTSGGVHALKFRYETGRVMCERCARIRTDTGNAAQGKML